MTIFGDQSAEKAKRSAAIVLQQLKAAGWSYRDTVVECLGQADSVRLVADSRTQLAVGNGPANCRGIGVESCRRGIFASHDVPGNGGALRELPVMQKEDLAFIQFFVIGPA